LHNLFREEAKECCFQNITGRDPITIDRCEGAVAMLKKEISFAIEARRNQEIAGMHHFEQFVGDEGTHEEYSRVLYKFMTKTRKLAHAR
jgi:hypothetical protein